MARRSTDTAVPVDIGRSRAAAMEDLGTTHRYFEIPGGAHDVIGMPDIFAFLALQAKLVR
jgi:hypothetical protein